MTKKLLTALEKFEKENNTTHTEKWERESIKELKSIGLTDYYFQRRKDAIEEVRQMQMQPISSEEACRQVAARSLPNNRK